MRQRGEGSIFKVKGSRNWYIRFGARSPRVSTHTPHKQKALAQLQELVAKQGRVEPSLRYEDARDALLQEYKNSNKRSLVKRKRGVTISGLDHLDKFFGRRLLRGVTTEVLREFVSQRLKEGASPSTVNRNLGLLRRIMHLARKDGRLHNVPYFPMPKEAEPRAGFVEHAQFRKLLAALPARLRTFVLLLYTTGIRTGEAKQTKWEYVDLEQGLIKLPGKITKNGKPRTIPLGGELLERLTAEKKSAGAVFPIGNFVKAWWSACVKAGLGVRTKGKQNGNYGSYSGLIPHDLRRSAVRNMVRAGISTTVARAISGHQTDAIFDRYDITSNEDLSKASAAIWSSYGTVEASVSEPTTVKPTV
jgi:integrase